MESGKSLVNFPEAFYPLVVITGDRREEYPQSTADLLVYSFSVTDLTYILHLNLKATEIYTDKYFVLYDDATLRRKFGNKNLLVIGSPAVNLLTRQINNDMLFRFNIQEESELRLQAQSRILEKIKFDRGGLTIYRELLKGAATLEEAILKTGDLATKKNELTARYSWLFEEFERTGLKSYKSLLHEFDRPGIWDSIDQTIHGASPKGDRDYGLVSIAKHPYAQDDFVAVCAAGVHGIATAQSLRLLAEPKSFENRPYGGVIEVQINTFGDWMDRFFDVTTVTWETSEYGPQHPNIPPKLLNLIGPHREPQRLQGPVKIYLSTPYKKDNLLQERLNAKIRHICRDFHQSRGFASDILDPFVLPKGGASVTTFAEAILHHMKDRDFVIHDVTGLAPGVLFEVGFSLGAGIDFFLLWDESRGQKLDLGRIPALLKNLHIEALDFTLPTFERILCERVFAQALARRATPPPDGGDSLPAPVGKAFVRACESNHESRRMIAAALRDHQIDVLAKADFPPFGEPRLTLALLRMAKAVLVDVTDKYHDGIITLGMCKALKLQNILMLARIDEDVAMWDGPKCFWSADLELRERQIQEEVSGFIRGLQQKSHD